MDDTPDVFEPHYRVIERTDQVQIYESVMVDPNDRVTTGLLTGVRYAKDNRILPLGFDPGRAPDDVKVHGEASSDPDFSGGSDHVRYEIAVDPGAGPFTLEAALRFQPIGFRWARELDAYDALETQRFVEYYDSMAAASAVSLAQALAVVD